MIRWSYRRNDIGPRTDRFWDIVYACLLAVISGIAAWPVSYLEGAPYWLSFWVIVCVCGGIPIVMMIRDPGLQRAGQRLAWSAAVCVTFATACGLVEKLMR